MSSNGISTLTYKADRQAAKLALAQAKREGRIVEDDGTWSGSVDPTQPYYRARNSYDITELPTVYTSGDNDTNNVTDNANPDGLIYGRPWISGEMPEPSYAIEFRSITGDPNDLESIQPADIITTCNEGDVIWFSLIGTDVPNDDNAYIQFGGANITNEDAQWPFGENILDPIPYNAAGTNTNGAPIGIVPDNLTEGNETLTLTWIVNGDIVAVASINIVDTSQNP